MVQFRSLDNTVYKSNYMRRLFFLLVISISLMSCGDSDSIYVTSINNNTSFDIIVHFSDDSIIVCQSKQETIIEEFFGSSVKKMSCMSPYIFKNIIIDGGNKILIKDISNDKNWDCKGDKSWSLIMVGNYYSKITTTFIINDEYIASIEQ